METLYSRKSRAERLIATGRAVLAGFFLLAIWLDPSKPSRYAEITYTILASYLGYTIVLAILTWRQNILWGRSKIIAHALDLMVFAIIMFLTEGPTSPFFVYFVFLLVCATLRWQWRGTLWTAVSVLATVIVMAFYPTYLLHDPNFELNRFIIRIVYLAVVAILLGYLGAYEQKLRGELSKLAAWPRTIPVEVRALVREMLEHAAAILGAPRMLLAWEEEEEPWLHLASWSHGEFHYTREPPAAFGALVAAPLVGTNFFCLGARNSRPIVVYNSPAGFQRWQGAPLHPQLQARFNARTVLGLRMHGKEHEGYIFAFDRSRISADDLVLGEIVVRELVTRLDQFSLLKQLQAAAAIEERIRLARDLHDGLLQFLTGAALQLETVHRLMEADPETARQRLLEIQRLIAAEQRDLRSQIRELKPSPPNLPEMDFELAIRLEELAERVKRHWGLRVEVNLKRLEPRIPRTLAQEIYFIIHESLINAARHAKASAVRAELAVEDNGVRILIADNGRGFPFRGRYDYGDLTKMNLGPVTLKERIASLGGSLAIDSSDTGTRLEITLPLAENGG